MGTPLCFVHHGSKIIITFNYSSVGDDELKILFQLILQHGWHLGDIDMLYLSMDERDDYEDYEFIEPYHSNK